MQVAEADQTLPAQLCPWIGPELPKPKVNYPAIDLESSGKVVKYCGLVLFRKFVLGIAVFSKHIPDKNASLANCTVSYDD